MANNSEMSITESQVMSEGYQSMPVPTKRTDDNDMSKIMQMLNKLDMKFDELKEQNSDLKSDVNEIKRQNCNLDRRINEIETRLDEIELEIREK